jgi:predicted ATP-dependent protease
VETALKEKQNREEVYRRHLLDVYKKNVFVVETSGSKVGQINGLAVMGSFGVPMRVTVVASKAAGMGGIVSVDRQASPTQTGPTFNKALGVVEGFLQNMFAQKKAFPVRLTISYEQNYGGIDGDSATTTEIYSILSALSGVPIGQNYAVTGSADQFGNVQAIGGVNEKIEGFFELCKARGLTGDQGIVIPKSNVADLQLSPEVVQAVKEGKFHIYAVGHVSEGLEVLTGVAYQTIVDKARARVDAMNAPEGKAAAKN